MTRLSITLAIATLTLSLAATANAYAYPPEDDQTGAAIIQPASVLLGAVQPEPSVCQFDFIAAATEPAAAKVDKAVVELASCQAE